MAETSTNIQTGAAGAEKTATVFNNAEQSVRAMNEIKVPPVYTAPKLIQNGATFGGNATGPVPQRGNFILSEGAPAAASGESLAFKGASAGGKIANRLGGAVKIVGKVAVPVAIAYTGYQTVKALHDGDGHKAAKAAGGGAGAILGFGLGTVPGAVIGLIGAAAIGLLAPPLLAPAAIVGVLGGFIAGGLATSAIGSKIGGGVTNFALGGLLHKIVHKDSPLTAPEAALNMQNTARGNYPVFDNQDATQDHVAALQRSGQQMRQGMVQGQ